ncbi:hypothetical protein RF11_10170 [Thelohanellus kitauei]|uniref:Uncharacterized protein n=1 Tax=Thelohanellus kitauei TaxID=669202 RepID=A0A0C2IKX0_THEKT|nr:hypothetical protein RF11_10170 [Thelohanellus kitauei]
MMESACLPHPDPSTFRISFGVFFGVLLFEHLGWTAFLENSATHASPFRQSGGSRPTEGNERIHRGLRRPKLAGHVLPSRDFTAGARNAPHPPYTNELPQELVNIGKRGAAPGEVGTEAPHASQGCSWELGPHEGKQRGPTSATSPPTVALMVFPHPHGTGARKP